VTDKWQGATAGRAALLGQRAARRGLRALPNPLAQPA